MESAMVGFLFVGAISAAMCGFVASDKGRTTLVWMLVGLIFPFVTLLVLIAVTNKKEWASQERRHVELLAALGKGPVPTVYAESDGTLSATGKPLTAH